MKIVYWSDYACPFCYIGITRLKKAARELGIEIELEMKAFQLDPDAPIHSTLSTVDRFAEKYRLHDRDAFHQVQAISEMGQAEGLDFHYETTFFTNTMDAHRLTKLASKIGGISLAEKISEKLYEAYFSKNLELADHEVLKKIALNCGIDQKSVDELLATDLFRDSVIRDEVEAFKREIQAVPFFIFGNRSMAGAYSIKSMKEFLNLALS